MIVAFVCTGNICRSPMAEAIARTLEVPDIELVSAGTSAVPGLPAARLAREVAAEVGADVSGHRSKPLSALAERPPDIIYVMEPLHLRAIDRWHPGWSARTKLLDPGRSPIDDPYGLGIDDYRAARDLIVRAVEMRADLWPAG